MVHRGNPDRGSLRREIVAGISAALLVGVGVAVFMGMLLGNARADTEKVSDTLAETRAQLARVELAHDPIAEYCRGVNDGQVVFGMANQRAFEYAKVPYTPATDEELATLDAHCVEYLTGGGEPPFNSRGPLDEAD